MELIRPEALIRFHDARLQAIRPEPYAGSSALRRAIADNHRFNRLLWRTEDQARRPDLPDRDIVRCKRAIDRYNQQRNDATERIDDALVQALEGIQYQPDARLHSETAGAMVDRLSILSLKIFHMHAQTTRRDAGDEHRSACHTKLQVLQMQRADLANCLARLLKEIERGETYFKAYRQFKMYNDPCLNPWLHGIAAATVR